MMIANFLPYKNLTCGDSWNWAVSLPSFPASDGWVVSLVFKQAGVAPFSLVSVPASNGLAHALASSSATTAGYTAGKYKVQIYITSNDGDRQTVGLTELELLADLANTSADYDPRTKAELALEAISGVLDGSASREVLETVFKDATFKYKSTNELIKLKNYYLLEINRERGIKDGRLL